MEHGAAKSLAEIMLARYHAALNGNMSAQNRFIERATPVCGRVDASAQSENEVRAEAGLASAHLGTSWEGLIDTKPEQDADLANPADHQSQRHRSRRSC